MSSAALPRALFRIRVAMIAGVLAFAVIAFFIVSTGRFSSGMRLQQLAPLRMLTWIAAGGAGIALVVMRLRLGSRAPATRTTPTILAWALGEFAALFGIVFFMLSGAESSAAPGLLAFATAMVLFPANPGE